MPPNTYPIKNVIVLMLENHSFDHMLGFLKGINSDIEGLEGTESIPEDPALLPLGSVRMVQVEKTSGTDGYVTNPDPDHEFENVNIQLLSQDPAPNPAIPTNNGFVLSYSRTRDQNGTPIGPVVGKKIMKCFDPDQIPILTTLAKNFVICDHWFCSVPGPTWPNRFFVHAATSKGHVDCPDGIIAIADVLRLSNYDMNTIYNNFETKGVSWKIYYHDFPQSLALYNIQQFLLTHFNKFNDFLVDIRNGNLPNYSFIEPCYGKLPGLTANDQHPPHNVKEGERLIATIYKAIRSNENLWNKSLFVILYDEHGGFYDHMHPPDTINPDGINSTDPSFAFDRLGVRVPAILVSPYVPKSKVDHTVYDHTSLLATVKKIFNLPNFLTKRDESANTFEHNFIDTAREDMVELPQV